MANAELNFTLLVNTAVSNVEEHYEELICKLSQRKDDILHALKVLGERYINDNRKYVESIAKIDGFRDTVSTVFKNNDSIEVKFREKQAKMCMEEKEEIWARMDNSSVKFDHNICIDTCINASGFLELGGQLNRYLESLKLDTSLFGNANLFPSIRRGVESTPILNESMVVVDYLSPIENSLQFSPNYLTSSYDEINSSSCMSLPANIRRDHCAIITTPSAISFDPETQCVFAVEGGKVPRIVVFTHEGDFKEEIYPLLPKKIRANVCLYGICVWKGKIYVSDIHNNAIIAIQMKGGNFIAATGKSAFNSVQNLTIDPEDGKIFACDKTATKVRVFDELLNSKKQFGEQFLSGPRDIKIRRDKIIVLDSGEYSLCYFSKDYVLLGHCITFFSSYTPFLGGIFFTEKARVQFFDIDEEGNSYITNVNSSSIHKFDMYGGHVSHSGNEDNKKSPHTKGIAIFTGQRIVSICTSKTHPQLQFLSHNQ